MHSSASAWWLLLSVPTWLIILNPVVGVTALLTGVMVMACVE